MTSPKSPSCDADDTCCEQDHPPTPPPSNSPPPAKQQQEVQEQNTAQSPIHLLPPEVLSLTFEFACPKLDFTERFGLDRNTTRKPTRRTQFDLSAVSTLWRQIAFSTPQLWTSIDIIIEPKAVERASNIMRTFFAGSGDLPLSIGLDFQKDKMTSDDEDGGSNVKPQLPTFHEHSHRIRELYMSHPPESWVTHLTSSYPTLMRLSIASPPYRDGTLMLNFPCSHLSLQSTSAPVELVWTTITTLHLSDLQEDVCLRLLMECVNMVEFKCRDPTSEDFRVSLPTSSFVLPHMKLFEWSVYSQSNVDRAMLQFIQMPVLETLIWVEEDVESIEDFDPRAMFFGNLPSTLRSLHLSGSVDTAGFTSATSNLIHREVSIEHLHARNCDFTNLNHLFDHLTIKPRDPERPIALPRLKAFTIRDSDSRPLEGVNFDVLLQMAESRLRHQRIYSPQPSLRLEIVIDRDNLVWSSGFRETSQVLIAQGLELEIIERSVPVKWL